MVDLEKLIISVLGDTLDGLAASTVAVQKRKLGLDGPLTHDQADRLIAKIQDACVMLAGGPVAQDMGDRLRRIIEEQS